jgi:hypothetical protein
MKAYKFFAFAMMACAVMMTACKKDNTPVTPDIKSDLPEVEATEGAVTVVWNIANIDEMCDEVGYVFAGNYNNWNTDPEAMVHFEAIAGYHGWFKAVLPTEEALQGKPCALAKDGTFPSSWDYQWIGTEEHPCEVVKGDATLEVEYEVESKLVCGAEADVVYVRSYAFKGNPCVEAVYDDVTFNLTVTNPVPEGHVVYIVGDAFEKSWDVTAYPMEGSGANWNITLKAIVGKEFKFVVDSSWTNDQMEYDEEKACAKAVKKNLKVDFTIMPVTVYGFLNFGVSEDQVCKVEPTEGVMYIKCAGNGWQWAQMTVDPNDNKKFTYESVVSGDNIGANISISNEADGQWYPLDNTGFNEGDAILSTFTSTDGDTGELVAAPANK